MAYVPSFSCQVPQVLPFSQAQVSAALAAPAASSTGMGCCGCDQGMGDYVSGFRWPIPQYLTPGNPRGLGDYISNFRWPIPQYLKPGNSRLLGMGDYINFRPVLPYQLPRGMGDAISIGGFSINTISPEGYFQGSITDWGIAEWGTIFGGIYVLGSLWGDTKKVVRKSRKAARAYRSTT